MNPKRSDAIHEDLFRENQIEMSSDRTLGIVFAACFLLLAFAPWLRGHPARPWAAAAAGVFLTASLSVPRVLRPLNILWTRLGIVLHETTNPIMMGLLFYTTVAPIGMFMRLLGYDALQLRWDRKASSYWIERTPLGRKPKSMKEQF